MQTQIPIKNLKKNMFVILPPDDSSSLFDEFEFLIEAREQIELIKILNLKNITIDISKSFKSEQPTLLSKENLKKAMYQNTPEKKAKIIYKQSHRIMQNLMDAPTAQKIAESKGEIIEVVGHIIDNDDMSEYFSRINFHDNYTYTHSVNVGVFSVMLAKKLFSQNNNHDLKELGAGFFLHDLGKIKISLDIINKKGRLTKDEFSLIQAHPTHGFNMLSEAKVLTEETSVIVMQHHEKYDGSGYPSGLSGEDIHDYGKICAIADVFDALTAKRSYKERMLPFEALNLMKEEMSNHFHKDMFQNFVRLFV